jgi:hypothetical protein
MEMVWGGVFIEHVELSVPLCGSYQKFQRIERPPIVNQNGPEPPLLASAFTLTTQYQNIVLGSSSTQTAETLEPARC